MDMNALMAAAGGGNGGPGGQAAAQQPPADDGKMIDLIDMINKQECYAKNESSSFPMSNLFIDDTRLGCKSDADEQMIIHIGFNEFVKLHSIKFTEFNSGSNPEQNPTIIKLFINRQNIGFEDADDIDPTQEFQLTNDDLKEDDELSPPILLKFVRFQRVSSLTIFIEDNSGGDITSLGSLKLYGKPIAGTNISDIKKSG